MEGVGGASPTSASIALKRSQTESERRLDPPRLIHITLGKVGSTFDWDIFQNRRSYFPHLRPLGLQRGKFMELFSKSIWS